MAWATKYREEHTDIEGVVWKTDIEEDSFAGAITTLTGTGKPLEVYWEPGSDDVFDPIQTSEASLEVFSSTNFALADLYAVQDLQFRMSIYQDDVLYWRGFVNSRHYKEPYGCPPYPVTITAVCGLEFLKDYLYASSVSVSSGIETVTYYDDFKTDAQIITDILAKIGVTGFTEYVNVYENSHSSGVGDSPLDQTACNTDVFRYFYCDEVLIEILKKYNARIIHKGGTFIIYRPKELTGSTVYGRIFTSATAKTSTSFTPLQYINRATHPANRVQIDGGVMMITRPAGKITVYQNYKSRDSWLDNYDFASDRISGNIVTTYSAEEWTKAGNNALFWPIKLYLPEESNGIVLVNHNNYPDYSLYIYQDFGYLAQITADEVFGISFDYQWINEQGSAAATQSFYFKVSIEAGANDYYLEKEAGSETTCVWNDNATPLYIEILEDVAEGCSGWNTWSRRIVSLPHAGPIRISFHCLNDAGLSIYMAIKNVRFIQTSNVVSANRKIIGITSGDARVSTIYTYKDIETIIESTYIVENKIGSTRINGDQLNYKYILGDVIDEDITNILEQFNGALATGSLSEGAAAFVTDHAGDYSGGGVIVTSSGNDIIMTSSVAGTAFSGTTTITNTSGNLSGSVVNTAANNVGTSWIAEVTLAGTGGTCQVGVEAVSGTATWDTDIGTTVANYVAAKAADFAAAGLLLQQPNASLGLMRFSGITAGEDFDDPYAVNLTIDLDDSLIEVTQEPVSPVAQVDTITLSGSTGTANILCDGVTQEVAVTVTPTSTWSTRGGSEAKALLKIIGDEIAAQYARPKQLIQMPIQEKGSDVSSINILGNFQDDLNQYSGSNRKFVFNRGKFDTKFRKWDIDLCEII